MKLTRKQIEIIRENTPDSIKGTFPAIRCDLGYYQPSGANWAYHAGYTFDGVLVVTQFGEVI